MKPNSISVPEASLPETDDVISEKEERMAEILEAYLAELEIGLPPDPESLLARFPDLADSLREHLKNLELLQVAGQGFGIARHRPAVSSVSDRRLGEFEIVREVGRGGMGIVYEAHQPSLQRKVALKVLPFAAVLDPTQIARFNNEARAAAQLHHPNIVPVFAVGCERGVHYYAMQFIEGQSLDAAINELRVLHQIEDVRAEMDHSQVSQPGTRVQPARSTVRGLSTAESIRSRDYFHTVARLGIQAAQALQYAHEHGVIHRDIKPSNLLLDETGKVWVADFGLARCQSETSLTAAGDVLGTVRYMSPEQAAGRMANEQSDIYSLGITLYELLTLRRAFDAPNRAQFIRQIEQDEPSSPRSLNSAIPFDLETIVLKAIAKSKDQRYATAAELAEDLQAFLASRTIRARRPSWPDRAAKWLNRHRTLATSIGVMSALLVIGSLISVALLARSHAETKRAQLIAEQNFRSAEQQRNIAARQFRQARRMLNQLGVSSAEELATLPGAEHVRQRLLRETLAYYERFLADFGATAPSSEITNSPVAADIAVARFHAANVHELLGEHSSAIQLYEQSLRELDALLQASSREANNGEHRNDDDAKMFSNSITRYAALSANNLGLLFDRQGDYAAAEKHFRSALERQALLLRELPQGLRAADEISGNYRLDDVGGDVEENNVYRPIASQAAADIAQTQNNFALLLNRNQRREEARESFLKAISILEKLAAANTSSRDLRIQLLTTYNNLAVFQSSEDLESAAATSQKAILLFGDDDLHTQPSTKLAEQLATAYANRGSIRRQQEKLTEAESDFRQAIRLQRELAQRSPAVVRFQIDLAVMLNNLGSLLNDRESGLAEEPLLQGCEILKSLSSHFPNDLLIQSQLAAVMNNIGLLRERQNNMDDAQQAFQEAIKLQSRAAQAAPQNLQFQQFLVHHHANFERVRRAVAENESTAP